MRVRFSVQDSDAAAEMTNDLTPDTRRRHPTPAIERLRQVRQVVDDCLVQRAAGQSLSDADLIARHPELMPELGEQLERIRLIACARERVDQERCARTLGNRIKQPIQRVIPSSIRLQCPHCQAMVATSQRATHGRTSVVRPAAADSISSTMTRRERLAARSHFVGRFELLELHRVAAALASCGKPAIRSSTAWWR